MHNAAPEYMPDAVDVRARAHALIASLNLLASASKSQDFIAKTYDRKALTSMTPEQQADVPINRSRSLRSKNRLLRAARGKFHDAYVIGNGPTPMNDRDFLGALGSFMTAYAPNPQNQREIRAERNAYRKRLQFLYAELNPEQLALYDDIDQAFVAAKSWKEGKAEPETPPSLTPTFKEPKVEIAPPIEIKNSEKLTTAQKLQALRDDTRAGFLPASHDEKTKALAFLDYMDNPTYPSNIAHQFQEIFVRQNHKLRLSTQKAAQALTSIGFEMGDYFLQARQQAVALNDLARLIDDCPNPKVTLAEEIGADHPGYAPLVRYLDILAVREQDKQLSPFDPLRVKVDRGPQEFEGKNKTVHDSYNATNPRPIVRERIVEQIHTLRIGDVRNAVVDAAHNEAQRTAFWQARLYDTYRHGAVWIASKRVLESVGLPINPRKLA